MSAFRGAHGKVSMTRLIAFSLALDAAAMAGAIVWYIVRGTPEATVLAAAASVVGAYVAAGCVAIVNRSRPPKPVENTPPPAEPPAGFPPRPMPDVEWVPAAEPPRQEGSL